MEEIHIEKKRNKDEDILYPMLDSQQRYIIFYMCKIIQGGGGGGKEKSKTSRLTPSFI
jgi:hypothetical protein